MRNAQIDSRRQRALAFGLALSGLLGGCAAFQKHPEPVAATPPPVAQIACVEASAIPAEPAMVGNRFNGDAKHDLQVLAPNAKALRDWGEQLRTMLEACAAKPADAAAPAAKP